MIKEIKYNNNFIELMSNLSKINTSLIFKHENRKLKINALSADKTVCFFLTAPNEYFEFDSDTFSVIDFNKIVSYYNMFYNPNTDEQLNELPILSVEYNENNEAINLFSKSSKTTKTYKHRLGNLQVIQKPEFSNINMPEPDTYIEMSEKEQINIINSLKLVGADKIKYKFSKDILTIILYNIKTSDTYEEQIKLNKPIEEDFEFTTVSSGFSLLPKGKYKINVTKQGLLEFNMKRTDDIDLKLYIVKENSK